MNYSPDELMALIERLGQYPGMSLVEFRELLKDLRLRIDMRISGLNHASKELEEA